MKLSRLAMGFAALLAVTIPAYAAGMFNNLPIVGGAAYCALYAGDGTTCAGSVPAGPSIVTGSELIPADTGLAGGSSPQTVLLSMKSIGALPYQYNAPLTGASVTVSNNIGTLLLDPAGTIATLTVVLPIAGQLVDGQIFRLASSQTVTALTLTAGTGTTISQAPSAITVTTTGSYGYEFIYRTANTKWYRLQ